MNWYDSLAGIIAGLLLWVFQDLLIMLYIHLNAKKKWNKNKRTYPYFSSNILKKLFLLGLRGAIDIAVIVLTFIFNISAFLSVISGVWNIIANNLIVEYCFRISLGIEVVCFTIRGLVFCFTRVNL